MAKFFKSTTDIVPIDYEKNPEGFLENLVRTPKNAQTREPVNLLPDFASIPAKPEGFTGTEDEWAQNALSGEPFQEFVKTVKYAKDLLDNRNGTEWDARVTAEKLVASFSRYMGRDVPNAGVPLTGELGMFGGSTLLSQDGREWNSWVPCSGGNYGVLQAVYDGITTSGESMASNKTKTYLEALERVKQQAKEAGKPFGENEQRAFDEKMVVALGYLKQQDVSTTAPTYTAPVLTAGMMYSVDPGRSEKVANDKRQGKIEEAKAKLYSDVARDRSILSWLESANALSPEANSLIARAFALGGDSEIVANSKDAFLALPDKDKYVAAHFVGLARGKVLEGQWWTDTGRGLYRNTAGIVGSVVQFGRAWGSVPCVYMAKALSGENVSWRALGEETAKTLADEALWESSTDHLEYEDYGFVLSGLKGAVEQLPIWGTLMLGGGAGAAVKGVGAGLTALRMASAGAAVARSAGTVAKIAGWYGKASLAMWYANESRDRYLMEGAPLWRANVMSTLSGVGQAFCDSVQGEMLLGKGLMGRPFTRARNQFCNILAESGAHSFVQYANALATKEGISAVANLAVGASLDVLGECYVEGVQKAIETLGLNLSVKERTLLQDVAEDAWTEFAESVPTMVFSVGAGHAISTTSTFKAKQTFASYNEAIRSMRSLSGVFAKEKLPAQNVEFSIFTQTPDGKTVPSEAGLQKLRVAWLETKGNKERMRLLEGTRTGLTHSQAEMLNRLFMSEERIRRVGTIATAIKMGLASRTRTGEQFMWTPEGIVASIQAVLPDAKIIQEKDGTSVISINGIAIRLGKGDLNKDIAENIENPTSGFLSSLWSTIKNKEAGKQFESYEDFEKKVGKQGDKQLREKLIRSHVLGGSGYFNPHGLGTVEIDGKKVPVVGDITIDKLFAKGTTPAHEIVHAVSYILKTAKVLTEEDIKNLRAMFGDPTSEDELFNEEVAAEAIESYIKVGGFLEDAEQKAGIGVKVAKPNAFNRVLQLLGDAMVSLGMQETEYSPAALASDQKVFTTYWRGVAAQELVRKMDKADFTRLETDVASDMAEPLRQEKANLESLVENPAQPEPQTRTAETSKQPVDGESVQPTQMPGATEVGAEMSSPDETGAVVAENATTEKPASAEPAGNSDELSGNTEQLEGAQPEEAGVEQAVEAPYKPTPVAKPTPEAQALSEKTGIPADVIAQVAQVALQDTAFQAVDEVDAVQEEHNKEEAKKVSNTVVDSFFDVKRRVEEVPVADILVNARITQFKRGADPRTGVTKSDYIPTYIPSMARPIRVMQFADGKYEVITGRHRLDAARRAGMETIPAIVYREADGMTVEQAKVIDATENVLDRKGSPQDWVAFFKDSGLSRSELDKLGLTRTDNKTIRDAEAIGRNGVNDVLSWALDPFTSEAKFHALGAVARAPRGVQRALLDAVLKKNIVDPVAIEFMGRALAENVAEPDLEQSGLFGDDDEALERARIEGLGVSKVLRDLSREESTLSRAALGYKDMVLREETKARFGIKDANNKDELVAARDKVKQEIRDWESPTLDAEKREQAYTIGLEEDKKASRSRARYSLTPTEELIREAEEQAHAVWAEYHYPNGRPKRGYLLAPNGKPTNLTEKQWLQVRTPAFIRWFGDWLKAAVTKGWYNVAAPEQFLEMVAEDVTNVVPLVGKQAFKDAFAKWNAEGIRNKADGRSVVFPKASAGKIERSGEVSGALKMLFENSRLAWSEKDDGRHNNIKAIHHYLVKAKTASGDVYVHFNVREDSSAVNGIHSATVSSVNVYKNKAEILPGNKPGDIRSEEGTKSFTDNKVAYFLGGLQDNSSKVVDENGEPKVVYHGSERKFWAFSNEKIGSHTDSFMHDGVGVWGRGHYFSDNKVYAETYQRGNPEGQTIAVYLNIRNPMPKEEVLRCSRDASEFTDSDGKNFYRDYQRLIDESIRKNGYDGVVANGKYATEYVAFSPTQVKSATDNVGTYSAAENDIRFSIRRLTDGREYVDIADVPAEFRAANDIDEKRKIVRTYIRKRWKNKVIDEDAVRVFVNGKTAQEYTNSAKKTDTQTFSDKLDAASELDAIVATSKDPIPVPDGENGHIHKDVKHWEHRSVMFAVGDRFYSAKVNIKILKKTNDRGENQRLLHDVTDIKDITGEVSTLIGYPPKETSYPSESAPIMPQTGAGVQGGARYSIAPLYTGTWADYDKPSLHHVGTGEGSQVYGWGLYATERRGIAEEYAGLHKGRLVAKRQLHKPRDDDWKEQYIKDAMRFVEWGVSKSVEEQLEKWIQRDEREVAEAPTEDARKRAEVTLKTKKDALALYLEDKDGWWVAPANVYSQTWFTDREPGDESHLLDWYAPIDENSWKAFLKAKRYLGIKFAYRTLPNGTKYKTVIGRDGEDAATRLFGDIDPQDHDYQGDLYRLLEEATSPKEASEAFARAGIDGVKYPANSYKTTIKDGNKVGWNYVSFRDDNLRIDHKWENGVQRYSLAEAETIADKLEEERKKIEANGGKLVLAYHGTDHRGFTKFERTDNVGYYFAGTRATAGSYIHNAGEEALSTPGLVDYQGALDYLRGRSFLQKKWVIKDGDGGYLRLSRLSKKRLADGAYKYIDDIGFDTKKEAETELNDSINSGRAAKKDFKVVEAEVLEAKGVDLEEVYENGLPYDRAVEVYLELASSSYFGLNVRSGIYDVAIRMDNPLEIDAEGQSWNNIYAIPRDEDTKVYTEVSVWFDDEKGKVVLLCQDEFGEETEYEYDWVDDLLEGIEKNFGKAMRAEVDAIKHLEDVLNSGHSMDIFSKFQNEEIYVYNEREGDGLVVSQKSTREIETEAKEAGYDGVIIHNVVDVGGGLGSDEVGEDTVYISFKKNYIKSIDKITYADDGSIIPISQRLNWDNDGDTRFSLATQEREDPTANLQREAEEAGKPAPTGTQKASGVYYPNASEDIRALNGKRYSFATDAEAIIKKKRQDVKDVPAVVSELQKFSSSAERKAALHWFVRGAIRLPEDAPKVTQALGYAKRAKADALKYDSPMACMEDLHDFKPKAEPINPDTVPELTNKREFDYGVTVYDVQDDRAGQRAMRRIINTHFGEDANPWCLLQGDGKGNLTKDAWMYWKLYNALPKRVAFRDGKLLCFIANNTRELACWDRQDKSHEGIPIGDLPAPENPYGIKTIQSVLSPDTGEIVRDKYLSYAVIAPLPDNPFGQKEGDASWYPYSDKLLYRILRGKAPLPTNPYGLKEGSAEYNPNTGRMHFDPVRVELQIPDNPFGETGVLSETWYPDSDEITYINSIRVGELPVPSNPYGITRAKAKYNLITGETQFSPVALGVVDFDTPFDGRREKAHAFFDPNTGSITFTEYNLPLPSGGEKHVYGKIKLPEGNPLGRETIRVAYLPSKGTFSLLLRAYLADRENRAWAENYLNEILAKFTPRTYIPRFSLNATERIEKALDGVTAESLASALDDVILSNRVAIRGTDSDKLAIKVASEAFFAKYSRMKIGLSTGAYLFFAPDERAVDRNGGDRSLAWAEYALHQVTNARTDKEGNRYRVFNREKVEVVNPQLEKIVREDKTEISEDGSVLFFSQLTNDTYAKVVARPVEDGNYRADLSDVTSVYGKGKIPGKLNPLAGVHDKGGLGGVFSPVSAEGTIANFQTPAQEGDARYALGVNPRLYEDVEEALNTDPENGKVLKGGTFVAFCDAPKLFAKLEMPTGKVYSRAYTLRKLAKEHDLTAEQIASAPELMASPVAVFNDNGRGYILLTDAIAPDLNGRLAPIMFYLRPDKYGNFIASAFSKTENGEQQYVNLRNGKKLLYVDTEKVARLPLQGEVKSSLITFNAGDRVKTPETLTSGSSVGSIANAQERAQGDKRFALYWLDPSLEEDPTPIFAQVAAERVATAKLSGKVDPLDGQIYKEIYGVNPEAVARYVDEYLQKNGRAFQSTEELIQAIGAEAYARQRDNKSLDAYIAGFAEGAGQASYATQLRMAQKEALKQHIENIAGTAAETMEVSLGFSFAQTVLGMFDAERKMSKEEIAERVKLRREKARRRYLASEKAEAGDAEAEAIFEGDGATAEDLAKYREAVSDIKKRAQEARDKENAEKDARKKKRDEKKRKETKKKKEQEEEEVNLKADIDAEELTLPPEVLLSQGIDLADPEALMWFVQQYVLDRWAKREADVPLEVLAKDPRVVRDIQCTLHNVLHALAGKLCYSGRRERVRSRADKILSAGSSLRRTRAIALSGFNALHASMIRETRKAQVQAMIDIINGAIGTGRFSEAMEQNDRSTSGDYARHLSKIRSILKMGDSAIQRKRETWDNILRHRSADLDGDAEGLVSNRDFNEGTEWLALLDKYGNHHHLMPGELDNLRAELEAGVKGDIQQTIERRKAFQDEIDLVKNAFILGIMDNAPAFKPERGRSVFSKRWLEEKAESFQSAMHLFLNNLIWRSKGVVRKNAKQAQQEIEIQLGQAADRKNAFKSQWMDAIAKDMRDIYGSPRAGVEALKQRIPEELNAIISKQGVRLTVGQVLMLYAYGQQTDDYHANIKRYGRDTEEYTNAVRACLTEKEISLLTSMRNALVSVFPALQQEYRDVTGVTVYTTRNYFPVKMKMDEQLGADVRVFSPIVTAMQPRVRNNRDVDENVDALSLFTSRLEDYSHLLGYGKTGIFLRETLGSTEVLQSVRRAHGDEAYKRVINKTLDILTGTRAAKMHDELTSIALNASRWVSAVSLSFNILSACKQLVSAPMIGAHEEVGMGRATMWLWKSIFPDAETKRAWSILRSSAGHMARYGMGLSADMVDAFSGKGHLTKLKRFYDAGMSPLMVGDALAGMSCGAGYYLMKEREFLDMGYTPEDAQARAEALTWTLIANTQQSSRTQDQPQFANNSKLARWFVQFINSPLQQSQFVVGAFQALCRGEEGGARRFANAFCAMATVTALIRVVELLFDALLGEFHDKDDDEKEQLMKSWAIDTALQVVGNPIFTLPVVGEGLHQTLRTIADGEGRFYFPRTGVPVLDAYNNAMRKLTGRLHRTVDWSEMDVEERLREGGGIFEDLLKTGLAPYRQLDKASKNWTDKSILEHVIGE